MKSNRSKHQGSKMYSLSARSVDRRHVLKSLGATIALPLLNAMAPRAATASSVATAAQTPKRIAFCYSPNGMIRQHWFPAGKGNEFELPQTLKPLEDLRNDLVLLDGLDRSYVGGADPHSQSGSCWMTSSRPEQQRDGVTPIDVTLDQVIARQTEAPTAFPSLEISCNTFTDNLEPKIFDAISWYGPGHDAPSENNPIELFRRLFGQSMTLKTSVLDVVLAEVADLKKTVGVDDRRKVDQYLQSIRAVEKRIHRQRAEKDRIVDLNLKIPESVPVDRGEYIRLMGDMMVLAFQTDMTRVASFMIGPERWQTPQMYDGVFENPMNHHEMTHDHDYDEEVALIDRFHVRQFAYMINKMKSIREGDGTLFDNSLIVFGSGLSDGSKHSYKRLPTIVAGGEKIVRGGRRLTVPQGTPLANLWLTIANQMGVKVDRFADSAGTIKGLFSKAE